MGLGRKETAFVCQDKAASFQRNKSLTGFVKFALQVKYACGVEIAAGETLASDLAKSALPKVEVPKKKEE